MNIILGVLNESNALLNEMALYLLFGFFFAGVLHVFLEEGAIARHLGKGNLMSVLKAALIGVPLPLCSCGVIPAALALKKEGASKGSILAFLVSTPTTGVDSIMVTYALMGGFFTFYRVVASFLAGVFAGVLANIFLPQETVKGNGGQKDDAGSCRACCCEKSHAGGDRKKRTISENINDVFRYAFMDLLGDSGLWLVIGILAGGVISYVIPSGFVQAHLGSLWVSMIVMLLVGIPMYVCSSGSVPIVAALMMKGMNPAAGLVFLISGPVTNSVALVVLLREMGAKGLGIFLTSVIISSLFFGVILDMLWKRLGLNVKEIMAHSQELFSPSVKGAAAVVLVVLIIFNLMRKLRK